MLYWFFWFEKMLMHYSHRLPFDHKIITISKSDIINPIGRLHHSLQWKQSQRKTELVQHTAGQRWKKWSIYEMLISRSFAILLRVSTQNPVYQVHVRFFNSLFFIAATQSVQLLWHTMRIDWSTYWKQIIFNRFNLLSINLMFNDVFGRDNWRRL